MLNALCTLRNPLSKKPQLPTQVRGLPMAFWKEQATKGDYFAEMAKWVEKLEEWMKFQNQ